MLSRNVYSEYLNYNRRHFTGIVWYYDFDDIDEIESLDLWDAVYDDLLEHDFAAMNIDL